LSEENIRGGSKISFSRQRAKIGYYSLVKHTDGEYEETKATFLIPPLTLLPVGLLPGYLALLLLLLPLSILLNDV
jgi:hypothetical protein